MFGLGIPELLVILFLIVLIVPTVLYCSTLKKSLILSQAHRGISPNLVWLLLVPIFNLGWQFYIIFNVTKGIKEKFKELNKDCGDGGWGIGLAYAILVCCSVVPGLSLFTGIPALVTWIIYWHKIANFNKQMA